MRTVLNKGGNKKTRTWGLAIVHLGCKLQVNPLRLKTRDRRKGLRAELSKTVRGVRLEVKETKQDKVLR